MAEHNAPRLTSVDREQPEEGSMAKFMIRARYSPEGLRGLQKDGGTGRQQAISNALNAMGGKLEGLYFALGEDDVFVICDMPDAASAAAIGIAVGASGLVQTRTTPLLTVEELDKAVRKSVDYRAPGR